MAEVVYENHLKSAYSVISEGRHLVITSTSFYQLSEETAWLIEELPDRGPENSYLSRLAGLGLNEPREIFEHLKSIQALKAKQKHGLVTMLRRILTPKIQLIPSKIQGRILIRLGIDLHAIRTRHIAVLSALSLAGLFWGSFLTLAGPAKAIPASLTGHTNWLHVFILALLGSLLHELGHSVMAAVSGIGLRPIGLSVYLVFPAFYTNASGTENVPFQNKALIDCGGFLFQGIYLFLLLTSASITGSYLFTEASRWLMVLIFFNLNPFLRTDAYWLYKDLNSKFKKGPWVQFARSIFLVGYITFSAYFLWRLVASFGGIVGNLAHAISFPKPVLSQGYMPVIWGYFLVMGFICVF